VKQGDGDRRERGILADQNIRQLGNHGQTLFDPRQRKICVPDYPIENLL
jgi:hypothetical protein